MIDTLPRNRSCVLLPFFLICKAVVQRSALVETWFRCGASTSCWQSTHVYIFITYATVNNRSENELFFWIYSCERLRPTCDRRMDWVSSIRATRSNYSAVCTQPRCHPTPDHNASQSCVRHAADPRWHIHSRHWACVDRLPTAPTCPHCTNYIHVSRVLGVFWRAVDIVPCVFGTVPWITQARSPLMSRPALS